MPERMLMVYKQYGENVSEIIFSMTATTSNSPSAIMSSLPKQPFLDFKQRLKTTKVEWK